MGVPRSPAPTRHNGRVVARFKGITREEKKVTTQRLSLSRETRSNQSFPLTTLPLPLQTHTHTHQSMTTNKEAA